MPVYIIPLLFIWFSSLKEIDSILLLIKLYLNFFILLLPKLTEIIFSSENNKKENEKSENSIFFNEFVGVKNDVDSK